jgi:heterodisulfide reductase subunit B
MKYALFLGCTAPVRSLNYELSARRVAEELGFRLIDLDDFQCCGFPVKTIDHTTALALAGRNLCLAEERGLNICTLCSACTATLAEANKKLREDPGLRSLINRDLEQSTGRSYHGSVEVKHFARVLLEDVGVETIREKVTTDLSALRLVAHYGCHYLKPPHIYDHVEDPENPHTLDNLIEATGARSIRFEGRDRCCGGPLLAVDEPVALAMAKEKLDRAVTNGCDAIVLFCPFCDIMYQSSQRKIEKAFHTQYGLPILYLPQLVGLALGLSPDELGFGLNRIKPGDLLKRVAPLVSTGNANPRPTGIFETETEH